MHFRRIAWLSLATLVACSDVSLTGSNNEDMGNSTSDGGRSDASTADGSGPDTSTPDLGYDFGPPVGVTNRAPRANGESFVTAMNTAVAIPSLLSNDVDPEGGSTGLAVTTMPSHGALVSSGADSFNYTPTSGFVGEDTFVYSVTDSHRALDSATVHIYVARNIRYVSSAGSDSAAGTSPETAWQTLSKVQSSMGSLHAGDAVLLRRGDVFRGTLSVSVDGTASEPFILSAYGSGAAPTVSGGTLVTGFTSRGDGSYAAPLATNPPHVYLNSQHLTLARYPNTGYLRTDAGSNASTVVDSAITQAAGTWNGANVRARLVNWSYDVGVVGTQNVGNLSLSTPFSRSFASSDDWGYIIDGVEAALDAEGEWVYAGGQLIVRPPARVDMSTATVEAVATDRGISLTGDYEILDGVDVRHYSDIAVRVSYLNNHVAIRHCNVQHSYFGIRAFADFVTVDESDIHNIYATGVYITGAGTTITRSHVHEIGSEFGFGEYWGNIGVSTTGDNVVVRENLVEDIGYIGISSGGGATVVERNLVRRTMLTTNDGGAISFDFNNGLQIRNNIALDSVGNTEAASMTQAANLRLPIVHGIYFGNHDIQNTTIEGNISLRHATGIHVDHTTRSNGNVVRNNITAFNWDAQIQFSDFSNDIDDTTTGGDHCVPAYNDSFEGNIMIATEPEQRTLNLLEVRCLVDIDWWGGTGTFDYNRFLRPGSTEIVTRLDFNSETHGGDTTNDSFTLATWREHTGQEAHSSEYTMSATDPDFVVLYNEDFGTMSIVLDEAHTYVDLDGAPVTGTVSLLPYTGRVLIRQ